jgi:hypothetical protein
LDQREPICLAPEVEPLGEPMKPSRIRYPVPPVPVQTLWVRILVASSRARRNRLWSAPDWPEVAQDPWSQLDGSWRKKGLA